MVRHRRGRPPLGDKAMTNAEKQAAWRERRESLIARLQAENAQLRAEIAALKESRAGRSA
jgi:hypothetical protein